MSRLNVAFAFSLTVLASGVAHAGHEGGYQIRSGDSSEHFRMPGAYDKQTKVPRPAEWRGSRLYVISHAERKAYAEATARAASLLRHDTAFRVRFGKIVPSVDLQHESWISQGNRIGVSLSALSPSKEEVAREEMAAAIKMASSLVGQVDPDPSRFVFDSSGKITGWYVAPPAPVGTETAFKMLDKLGEGANANAYRVHSDDPKLSSFGVIKILKPYAPRRAPVEAPLPMLTALSREAEFLSEAFAKDEAFAKRFGNIIPKTQMIAPGVIAQELATGKAFDSLDEKAQLRGREDIAELRKMAKRIAPGVIVTGRTKNYLFNSDGSIASLYDIASDGHKAYAKAGLKDRIFAHQGTTPPASAVDLTTTTTTSSSSSDDE